MVRIEAAVLDRHERLRHVARQILQRHRGAAHVAAGGERMALHVDDLDRGRTLGDFERLDRRQVGAHPHGAADDGDHQPEADHRSPIGDPPDAPPAATAALALPRLPLALGPLGALGGGRTRGSAGSAARSVAGAHVEHGFATLLAPWRCHIAFRSPSDGSAGIA